MKIKPTYVTFEQSKLLKEKGFDINTRTAYDYRTYQPSNLFEENLEIINNAKNYSNSEYERFQRPEQWQVVEWLRVNHGIWISVQPNEPFTDDDWCMKIFKNNKLAISLEGYDSPQEAYSAAFDYILTKDLI
jgi:hypothetical protein